MDAQIILQRLVEMAGGPSETGYVLAIASDALREIPSELPTSKGKYAVVRPTSEIGLRHLLWKARGAPILALVDESLANRLPADLVRRSRGGSVHAVELGEVLSLALRVPVVAPDDVDLQRLAIDNVDRIRALIGERTLPTVVDCELLDELVLDAVLGPKFRRSVPAELLKQWLLDPPKWSATLEGLVGRQLKRMHGLEGRILAWALEARPAPSRLEAIVVNGILLALDEEELPQAAWGEHLWNAPATLGLTRETFRRATAGLARRALDALGSDATAFLEKAGTLAKRVLVPAVIARSEDLPLGLDNLCFAAAQRMVAGEAVGHDAIQRMQRHRFATARKPEIAVLEQMARLSRYLVTAAPASGAGVTERVRHYQREGAFADWAAARLHATLAKSSAFRKEAAKIVERYRERRNEENRGFAELLAADYVSAVHAEGCVSLHRVWTRGPVRAEDGHEARLFLVVLDGCSYPVFLRLVAELANEVQPLGLRLDAKTGEAQGTPALAVLPTITSHSRSAIFLGEIPKDPWIAETVWRDTKESVSDPARFKQNAALGSRTRRLFLKRDLGEHGDALLAALGDPALEIVAVVFNAVDDQIGSSNTGAALAVRAEDITAFIPSLREALRAGRRVVLTADHGHTPFVDTGKAYRVGDGASARYCALGPKDAVPTGFIEIPHEGLGGGPERKAFAWKMGMYQGQPQVGFHGGCSLEEMVVPLAEIVGGGVAADVPAWWYAGAQVAIESTLPVSPAPPAVAPPKAGKPSPTPLPTKAPVQGDFFDPQILADAELDRMGLPAAVRAKLDASEKAALVCVFSNQSAKTSDIAKKLNRPMNRVGGMMSRLESKLHDAKVPCLRHKDLPAGEVQYTYVPQGTERKDP